MTQRRKIAIAFVSAVPVVLAIVLVEHIALFRVVSDAGGMAQEVQVLQKSDAIISLLSQAEAQTQKYIAAGGDDVSKRSYQGTVSELNNVIQYLHDFTKSDPSTQSHFQTLDPLVAKRIGLFQQAMDSIRRGVASIQDRAAQKLQGQRLTDEIGTTITDIKTPHQIRLQQQEEAASRSARIANTLNTYGGTLVIWLIGVAAFLLFHDEEKSTWDGVERRVHTKILESLPLGVCLTTDSGLILYTNRAEEDIFGYQPGELIGRNMVLLHSLDGQDAERPVSEIFERLDLTQVWSGELPIRKKDGTILKTALWIMNMEIPGKHFRIFVHYP